jgi:hypothetical protein
MTPEAQLLIGIIMVVFSLPAAYCGGWYVAHQEEAQASGCLIVAGALMMFGTILVGIS